MGISSYREINRKLLILKLKCVIYIPLASPNETAKNNDHLKLVFLCNYDICLICSLLIVSKVVVKFRDWVGLGI